MKNWLLFTTVASQQIALAPLQIISERPLSKFCTKKVTTHSIYTLEYKRMNINDR